jgi:cell division protein FtsQ
MLSLLAGLAAATAIGVSALSTFSNAERRQAALAGIERVAEAAGLSSLQQLTVTGHRFALDSDIFDAVDLGKPRTLLSFDARAARKRVEALPWIERASIERIVPDRIEVRVTERAPFAVWRLGDRNLLVAKDGRVLQALPAGIMSELPRVAGEGAGHEAAALFAVLATHPTLARQVEVAERFGERRWTLRLSDGTVIHLPADGEGQALARLARMDVKAGSEIDLRLATRVLTRDRLSGGKAERGAQGAIAGRAHPTTRKE